MNKMKELYEEVAKDSPLQAKFNAIIRDSEKAGKAATEEKLIAFAKEAGYEISLVEMWAFFKELAEKGSGQLSDAELDMVAGGKLDLNKVANSVVTYGAGCVEGSLKNQIFKGDCLQYFQQ